MNIEEAKKISIADYLHSLGCSPVKRQGANLWYKSPLREETEASFKVNTDLNKWYDFGLGKGGNIIALAGELYGSDHVPYLLERMGEQAPLVRPVSFSFRQQRSEPSFRQLEVRDLTHPALLRYLQGRGEKCLVFEGFMDYLSFLTLRVKNCPAMPNLDRQDYIILNSTANVPKAIDALGLYERIHCLLDNDAAGFRATQAIAAEYTWRVRDFSHNYRGYSDLNDYLCGRKQEQKNGQNPARERKKGRGI